jgi:hypothetical protein
MPRAPYAPSLHHTALRDPGGGYFGAPAPRSQLGLNVSGFPSERSDTGTER